MQMNQVNGRKVALFIDDDPSFLKVMEKAVQHPRFFIRTYQVSSGYKVIDEIIKIKPDVLFIDFCSTGTSNSQILFILRAVQGLAQLKIYLVTGYSKDDIKQFLSGFDLEHVLVKDESLKIKILSVLDKIANAA
ncbi:MAG: hypothetical protein A3A81_07015 [Omnitrophica bacterium RIFCSPLOWO2_01_FULL_45_10b]|nr:MAG: hypothetical protein A3A81_07015 [Omnitrophica bacterium RIFCSPLOWO2_01_FULL_45_10b]